MRSVTLPSPLRIRHNKKPVPGLPGQAFCYGAVCPQQGYTGIILHLDRCNVFLHFFCKYKRGMDSVKGVSYSIGPE